MQEVYRASAELTQRVKHILGEDVVKEVFITTYDEDFSASVSRRLDDIESELHLSLMDMPIGHFPYDGLTLLIRFVNDRVVEFQNSEWAYMQVVPTSVEFPNPVPFRLEEPRDRT